MSGQNGPNGPNSSADLIGQAIAAANSLGASATKVGSMFQQLAEQGTETVGKVVTPIAEHPLAKYATRVPGLNWFLAALGHVNTEKVHQDVEQLRQQYPLETPEQLAHRIIVDSAIKAAGIGLATNLLPPIALTLFAADLVAVTALQAEMIYRIAAAYGFSLTDPARRGEILAIFGLSMGGSGVMKTGLGLVELIPGVGTVVGASGDALLLYSLGYAASRFYESKHQAAQKAAQTGDRLESP